jgi:hypothetical protein
MISEPSFIDELSSILSASELDNLSFLNLIIAELAFFMVFLSFLVFLFLLASASESDSCELPPNSSTESFSVVHF